MVVTAAHKLMSAKIKGLRLAGAPRASTFADQGTVSRYVTLAHACRHERTAPLCLCLTLTSS
jgi:hypothetical protein